MEHRPGQLARRKIQSIIPFVGGKWFSLDWIVPVLDSIRTKIYCEPFGGSAIVLLNLEPRPIEVYNDIDGNLVNFFKVIAVPEKFERFARIVSALPYSRELYELSRLVLTGEIDENDDVMRAVHTFVVYRQSFGGKLEAGWGFGFKLGRGWVAKQIAAWMSAVERLPIIHARLSRVFIEHNDWSRCVELYDTPDTLFYLDPPYHPGTRRGEFYASELSREDHIKLVDTLLSIEGSWVLSGYDHPDYQPLEASGARKLTWSRPCSVAGNPRRRKAKAARDKERVECLWVMDKTLKHKSIFHLPLFVKPDRAQEEQRASHMEQEVDEQGMKDAQASVV